MVQSFDGITKAEFAVPHPDLRRYVTTYYVAEVQSSDGREVEDLIHPEWGSVRYLCSGSVKGSILPDPLQQMPQVALAGHSSRAGPLCCISMRVASFGLLPLGWHRFVGLPAANFADKSVDANGLYARMDFAQLHPQIASAQSLAEIAQIFDTALLDTLAQQAKPDRAEDELVEAVHRALLDPNVATVAEMTGRLGMSVLQLERLSKRVFGFPPKLLLRRQRFLRTLNLWLRQPNSKWADILDPQYYDQAHFNRDFRRFFGMAPTQYLTLPRPIIMASAMARMAALGDPLQGLQQPGVKSAH